MATSTMGNAPVTNKTIYWVIGTIVVIALILFLALRNDNRNAPETNVHPGSNPMAPAPGMDGTNGTGTQTQ